MSGFQKPKNPALSYISTANQPNETNVVSAEPEEQKEYQHGTTQIVYIEKPTETKSKRKNLLLYPSVHDKIEKLAKEESLKTGKEVSFNDLVNRILIEYAERH